MYFRTLAISARLPASAKYFEVMLSRLAAC